MQQHISNPAQIKKYLDKFVAGQEEAKKLVAVACFNHLQCLQNQEKLAELGLRPQKQNILLIGPSGSGKTFMMEKLAELLEVPFTVIDSTTLTQSGYTGAEPEQIIEKLYLASGENLEKTQQGIIFLDEIDKKAKKVYWSGGGDHTGIGVQQCLLKLLEDATVTFERNSESITIDTKNILFVAGGAFPGLEKLIAKRCHPAQPQTIGLMTTREAAEPEEGCSALLKKVMAADIIEFGFLHEFVGRFPVIVTLDELGVQDLCYILSKVDNNLVEQYKAIFLLDDINLIFENEALEIVAKKAKALGCGARSLRAIMEKLLLYPMYSAPQYADGRKAKLIITKEIASKGKCPAIMRKLRVPRGSR